MVLKSTVTNISVLSWRSVLLVEETGVPGEKPFKRIVVYLIKNTIKKRFSLPNENYGDFYVFT